MLRLRFNQVLIVVLSASAWLSACGSSDDADADSKSDAGSGDDDGAKGDGGDDDIVVDPVLPDGPDLPPAAFPTTTPLLFGYTLEDAFPGTFLSGAMDMAWPAGSKDPFVLQRGGHIVRLLGGGNRTLVLNFEGEVAQRAEAGALGMALHPKFADAGDPHPYVYIWFNAEGAPTHQKLVRYTWNGAAFDPGSVVTLVDQIEAVPEHNGAHIRFGADGFLYFANGDDTRRDVTTQTLTGGLFSGIFRIDVDSRGGAVSHAPPKQPSNATTTGYFIPNDNPFVGTANAAEEYFALGFRNPYSFTFDRANGSLWLGDVGDTFREEIDLVTKGGNYGWPFFEGMKQVRPGTLAIGTPQLPKYDYTHASLGDLSAVVAGYVYRGAALPEIAGKLLFSDWPTGRVWALDTTTGKRTSLLESNTENAPVGWGQDPAGEVYLVAWSKILKVVRAPAKHTVPSKLSETNFFINMGSLKPSSSLTAYALRSPLWSDGAAKQRWVYVPPGKTAEAVADGSVTLPVGSIIVKHFSLPESATPSSPRTRKLETRVLVVGEDSTYGVTYKWNRAGTDADLLIESQDETIEATTPDESRTWHFPSAGECWSCHRSENRVLGFRGEQLNFGLPDGTNQLAAFAAKGVFDTASIASAPAPLASPSDETAPIEDRATAYLAANCAHCHHPGASFLGGGDTWNALPNVPVGSRGLVGVRHHNDSMAVAFGLPNGALIAPGDPDKSILMKRMQSTDVDLRMPPLGRSQNDPVGVRVIDAWIRSIAP